QLFTSSPTRRTGTLIQKHVRFWKQEDDWRQSLEECVCVSVTGGIKWRKPASASSGSPPQSHRETHL
ncbi:Hypothetical predicted protein, partial [Scomber scombrus]